MERFPVLTQWFMLLAVSLVLGFGLLVYHVPAALLLGPMLVGVVMGLNGATIRIPRPLFYASNAVLGCLVAQSLSLSILMLLVKEWPLVLFILLSTLVASGLSGWLLMRYSELPGTTGTWGASPGGASAMVAMAGDFGADVRLVAFMQYLRLLMVTASAAFVARASLGQGAEANNALLVWFPALDWRFPGTLVMAFSCAWVGRRLRIPSGQLLVPMIVGSILHSSGIMTLQTPEWLLAVAYALIGWSVGLAFTRTVFLLALRTLPKMMLSIITLMLLCGGMALMLTHLLSVDMLTAYLATSPGGLDSIAVIAASSRVDIAFVMAFQTMRLFSTLIFSPILSRYISRHAVVDTA
ncbi:AbrB family transcriptional regulator [Dickeya dianthicola]|uniref:AbrB family transcriptional regulator n=1 Tax=Dickeya dianthicola TaxID=204039 RepID=A0AAP2D410_9GAMM|nr:AbrB family transcriptional regulator [Dickeya dianthicola]MBI0438941.1 AbrB family transcriptional regulator [Dickeya dianthicola]MBI0449420.1 AbrB family transcriptional regulator [Dickeya dianthicola]MBI0453738.1 AbrB family transcriptional regulator [Dickeya dianthicola]MBI0459528.1 AbrB family transcriptional regulator [Dickeya dianthicola]MBI0462699.1 AbrB family transcriptional regulator [Dickeya dianthicola]